MRFCFVLGALLSVLGCSTTASFHILPGEEGLNDAFARGVSKEEAEATAIDGAKQYCSAQNLPINFLSHSTNYVGTMDEGTRSTLRATSQVAMAAGAISAVTDSKNRDVASGLGAAGAAGYVSTNTRDYETRVRFRCGAVRMGDQRNGGIRPWPYW